MNLPGFPIAVGGTTKYVGRGQGWGGSETDEEWCALARLVQQMESAFVRARGHDPGSAEDLTRAIREVVTSENFSPYLETIHAAHVVGDTLEVEFSAVGYPDRYASHVCVHGSGSRYKLQRAPEPKQVISSRCEWVASPQQLLCVGEALDGVGTVQSRVSVSFQQRDDAEMKPYAGKAFPEAEACVMQMARALVLRQGGRSAPR